MSDSLTAADLSGVRLIREQQSRVKDLKGFRKSHKVPTEMNDRTVAFVQRAAATDLSEELDVRFEEFRKHCRFKRTELTVSEPEAGRAMIATPWFDYIVNATLASDNVAMVSWRRQLAEFRPQCDWTHAGLTLMFMGAFDTVEVEPETMPVLPDLIDQIEDSPLDGVRIEYDRQATWCQLTMTGVSGLIRISQDCVSLVATQPASAATLLESFVQLRGRLNCIDSLRI